MPACAGHANRHQGLPVVLSTGGSSQLFSSHPHPNLLQLMGFSFPFNPVTSAMFSLLSPSLPPHCWSPLPSLSFSPAMTRSCLLAILNLLPSLSALGSSDASAWTLPPVSSKSFLFSHTRSSHVFSSCARGPLY